MTRNLAGEEGGTDPWARLLPMFCEILLSLTEPSLRLATISEIPRCDNQQLKDLLVVGSAEEAPRKGPPPALASRQRFGTGPDPREPTGEPNRTGRETAATRTQGPPGGTDAPETGQGPVQNDPEPQINDMA